MALLENVGTYLASEIGSLTLGTNLFLGRLPDAPDTCVALFEYGGEAPRSLMGGSSTPALEQPRVQVLTRAVAYSAARTLAGQIWTALEEILDENLSGVRYHRVAAVQSVFALERDSQDRIILAQNFAVIKAY
jgi:hypothetical protein